MKYKAVIGLLIILKVSAFTLPVDDFIQKLTKKLERFKTQTPQVKLFLFFNQQMYMPGDTAYFSARFLTEDMKPVAGRQIVRLELVDAVGKILFFQNIGIKDGHGSNQVAIPSQLKAGVYTWVAYSDWMRNFDPQLYFKQDFVVVENNDLEEQKSSDDPKIKFSPEGGRLIATVNNKVIVSGAIGIDAINVVDDRGERITDCKLSARGVGQFVINPAPGKQYFAEANMAGKSIRVPLQLASNDGVAMDLSIDKDNTKLDIRVPEDSKLRAENLWVMVTSLSEIYLAAPARFDNKELLSIQFQPAQLPHGVCYATIFTERGEPLAERLFAVDKRADILVETFTEKQIYNTRENVNLQVKLKDGFGKVLIGDYAVSIVNKRLTTDLVGMTSIRNYLLINSELTNHVSYSSYDELNLLLATQKNIRMDWNNIWDEKFSTPHSFKRMIQYSGSIVNRENDQPIPDSSRLIAYLQRNMMGYEAATRKDGSFDLAFLFDFWNEDEIFYMVENKRGKELNTAVHWNLDSVSQVKPQLLVTASESPNSYAQYRTRNQFISDSYNFFKSGADNMKTAQSLDPNRDFEEELSGADYSVKVEDYVVFPTMEELIREVIPSLQHRKVKGKSQVRVVLPDGAIPPDGPLYMIDGIMTRDTDYFLQLKPGDVITVKIVRAYNKLTRMGLMARNGIVLVYTKGVDHKALKAKNTMLPLKGLNKPVPFRNINHNENDDKRIPDFRSTIYWNPSVKVDGTGNSEINFSCSDDVGTFLILIQGMTADGRAFEKLDSIQVKFSRN